MWKKISRLVSALCILTYLFAAGYGMYHVIRGKEDQRIIAGREFSMLADMVQSAGVLASAGKSIESDLKNFVNQSLCLDAVIVTAPDGRQYSAEKPDVHVVTRVWNSSGGTYRFNTNWKFYPAPLNLSAGWTVSAVHSFIDKENLITILKECLLFVIIGLLASFIVFLLDVLLFDGVQNAAVGLSAADIEEALAGMEKRATDNAEPLPETKENVPAAEEALPDPAPQDAANSGLKMKLAEELARCDANGPDLTLLCMVYTSSGLDDEGDGTSSTSVAKAIAKEAAVFFKNNKVSAFKKAGNGIFLVLPYSKLSHILKYAKAFHARLLRDSELKTAISSLFIGLSARAGRQMEPSRLILEAEKAAEMAAESPSQPIVAFKADPQRFQLFMKKKHL